MPARILPQELFDNIIDHAHDDPSTLKDCALVCWSWLPSSRYHRFHRVSLRVAKTACSDNADALDDDSADAASDCERLYRIVASSPEIIPYIRSLVICEGSQCGGIMDHRQEETLPLLLRLLTGLRTLEFEPSYPLYRWPTNLIDSINAARCLPSVTELGLFGLPYYNRAHFIQTLRLCPALKVLQLKDVHFVAWEDANTAHYGDDEEQAGDDTATQRALLDSLSVESPCSSAIIDFLLHTRSSMDLSNLYRLNVAISGDSAPLARLLRVAPCLEYLEIEVQYNISSHWLVPDPLDVSYNPLLRSLDLRVHVLIGRHDPLAWLHTLFSTVGPTNCLEEISLMVTIDLPPPDLDLSAYAESLRGWREIDSVLARPVLSSLRRVHIDFALDNPIDDQIVPEILDDILSQFPNLDNEGILFSDTCEVR